MTNQEIQQSLEFALRFHRAGDLARAESVYRQILQHNSELPQVLQLLGVLLHQRGQSDLSLQHINRAIALNPSAAEYHSNRGAVLKDMGRHQEAIASFRTAIQMNPGYVDGHFNLANALLVQRDLDAAIAGFNHVIRLQPDSARAHVQLGDALWLKGQSDPAIDSYRRAIRLSPDLADAHNNLGQVLQRIGRLDDALESFQAAQKLRPDLPGVVYNMANTLCEQGRLDEAIAHYRRAMAIAPTDSAAGSNLLYILQFYLNATDSQLKQEHTQWTNQYARSLQKLMQPHTNARDPNRRLRIGYVSPDFYLHAECFFVVPLLESHDHAQFEVHGYSSVDMQDVITDRVRKACDVWHDVKQLSNQELAEQIRRDGIDVLIDLTMHMSGNRLLTFAQKPAPVQMTWLAYPGSTGLATIDYRITDRFMDLPGQNDSWCTELPIYLPDCWVCYDVLEVPPVNELPALHNGHVTFGSFNNFAKMNDAVLGLWARVLTAIPRSRLLLLAKEGSHRQRTMEVFRGLGVLSNQIEFISFRPRGQYLELYHRTDIALDPFPYNGITTTCDAMWMGVPVISRVGNRPAARAGLGLLSTVSLPEFAAKDDDSFVSTVTQLANDLPRLSQLRATLRQKVQNSPLADSKRFARNMENAYRTAWQKWCAT